MIDEDIVPLFFRKWMEVMPLGMSPEKKAALQKAVSYLKSSWFDDVGVKNWFQGWTPWDLSPIISSSALTGY